MEVGIRVVRGPDWQWRNQDDGEGHLGTVVEIGRPGSRTSPEKTVIVQWDSGSRTNYRVGYQSKYDLRIYDNATIGIRHSNVICDNCKKRGIQGIRWKCTKCFDFDLCTHCYMADKHDLTHQFLRFETSTSQGVLMPKRLASVKIAARGIFAGAICVRGPDWEWQNQDGGCGKTGKVIELRGWDRESGMSVACVEWSTTGTTNVYRVGHKGKADLKYVQEGDGGFYYRDHLIVLGQPIDSNSQLGLESNTSSTTMTSTSTTTPTTASTSSTTTPPTTRQHSELISSDESSSVILDTILPLSPPPTPPTPTASTSIASSTNNNSTSSSPLQSNCLNINQALGSEMTMSISHNSANMNSNNNNNKTSNGQHESTASSASTQFFSVGDKVRVDVSLDMFKQMQEGHGGWNFKMADLIGKVGTIHRVTDKGDIRVQYEGADNRWTIYPGALTKLSSTFAEGDCVRINSDEEHVKTLQKGHGEWSEKMKMILGKICRVLTVYGDGDLRITYNNFGFTVNSACCTCVSKHQTDIHNTIAYHNMEDAINMANQLKDLLDDNSKVFTPESIDQLVREAAHGNIQAVKDLLSKNPNLIDQKSSGKTALQVSCHQGHVDIVKLLISSKANLEIQDAEGDTALHYSCFGNQPEITELLLQKNSNINSTNKNGCTALHVAVNKQHVNCVKVLLKYKCDVNLQDFYGDTAMHDIIGKEMSKESKQIIDLLLSTPSINLAIRNKRGFNILHYASLKGNAVATEKLISYSPQLVDIKKDDGFSAFHLAALNGHKDVIKILVQSKADKEILNNRRQTPLLLAVAQLHAPIIELLVEKKANVNAFDEDGDTCLHLALNDKLTNSDSGGSNNKHINSCVDLKDCKLLSMISQNMPAEYSNNIRLIISSYLIQNGAKLTKNKHQISPLDYLADAKMSDLLQKQCLAFEQEEIQEKCKLCDEEMRCVVFVPCGHKIVCLECSVRMKKCLDCNQPIKEKVTCDGTPISSSITTKSQFNDLLSKIKSLEEAQICSICMERKKDTAFQCGHIVCNICALPLKTCHICREKIVKRIKIYET